MSRNGRADHIERQAKRLLSIDRDETDRDRPPHEFDQEQDDAEQQHFLPI